MNEQDFLLIACFVGLLMVYKSKIDPIGGPFLFLLHSACFTVKLNYAIQTQATVRTGQPFSGPTYYYIYARFTCHGFYFKIAFRKS